MTPQLREYQTRAIDQTRLALSQSQAACVVMPTGAGKTTVMAEIARRAVLRGRKVVALAHRSELIDQIFDRMHQFGLTAGAVSASSNRPPNPFADVQVCSIQTLLARQQRPVADLILADECHHLVSDEWSVMHSDYPESKLIGFTATPERGDGRGLGSIFQRIVVGVRVRELVDLGYLSPCEIRRPASILRPGTIAQRPVDAYQKHAPGRRAICFSPSVQAAEEHARDFNAAGIVAKVITGDTDPAERSLYLDAFRSGDVRVLVNVFVLTEGTDLPATDCIILARSCGTQGTFIQMTGRGARSHPGKRDYVLIDLHGVSHVHGHPEDDRRYSLDGTGIRCGDTEDLSPSCRVCGAIRDPGQPCPDCGTEAQSMKPQRVTGEELVPYAAKRAESDDKRAETAARWIALGQAKGYKNTFWKAKYRAVYGSWPGPSVESAAFELLKRKGAA